MINFVLTCMKRTAGIILRTIILLLLGIAIGLLISNNFGSNNLGFGKNSGEKLARVLDLVNSSYVDTVDTDSIEGATINDLLQNLDPHSIYLPPQKAIAMNERLDGGFNGIGIEYQLLRDTLVITQVYKNGPAAKAGIHPGDKVINVDNKKFSGTQLTAERVNKVFRGEKNSVLAITVQKAGTHALNPATIKRGFVDLSSLDAAYIAAPGTGYIKIGKFSSTSDTDFRAALKKLKALGMHKLVLDLRGNGGGYLNTATSLADEFLPKGKFIVYTKGVHEPRTEYFSTDSGVYQQGKLAVLIDEYSASASEILSGALQDLDRAVIVGRRSFGKGLVQQQYPFGDGSAINLTIARYYTPSGRSIQKSYKGGLQNYRNELADRMRKGELFSAETNLSDSIFKRNSTYHTANGRKVFSGGGIMPDVFIPADTNASTLLMQQLYSNQLFTAYVIDNMQTTLNTYKNAEDFYLHYGVSNDELNRFIIYASQTIKEMDSQDLKLSTPAIRTVIKAFAARFKWGDEPFYRVMNANDPTFKKALDL